MLAGPSDSNPETDNPTSLLLPLNPAMYRPVIKIPIKNTNIPGNHSPTGKIIGIAVPVNDHILLLYNPVFVITKTETATLNNQKNSLRNFLSLVRLP